nr:hypothetical protein [Kribbella sp. VKM Ac-2527]
MRRRTSAGIVTRLPEQHLRCRGAGDAASHVHVLGHRRLRVSEVVGDLAGRQTRLVQSGRDGLPAGVRRDPVEVRVGAYHRSLHVAVRVGRVPHAALQTGEQQAVRVVDGCDPAPAQLHDVRRQGDDPPAGVRLRPRLQDRSLAAEPNGDLAHLERPGLEVDRVLSQAKRLADPQPRTEHEFDEVDDVLQDRPRICAGLGDHSIGFDH